MKDILVAIGSFLFGLGALLLLWSACPQDSPNPIMVLEIYRQAAFYWSFGVTTGVGLVMLTLGVFANDH